MRNRFNFLCAVKELGGVLNVAGNFLKKRLLNFVNIC